MARTRHIVLFLLAPFICGAQSTLTDTVVRLPVINISSSRVQLFTTGLSIQKIDSLAVSENPGASLSEIISNSSPSYIKSYGLGGISTISIRGTSANQTGILWNGLKLSPPNLGYVDLSLIQGDFFRDVNILYGGTSPMYGSGMIGGSIHLDNVPVFTRTCQADLAGSYGSFNTYDLRSKAIIAGKHFFSSTGLAFRGAQNNFQYQNLNNETVRMMNAVDLRNSLVQDLAFRIDGNQYLQASLWYSYADREIAPTSTQESSNAYQVDRSVRTMMRWTGAYPRSSFEVKAGYFNEYMNFTDPSSDIHSLILTKTYTGAFESEYRISGKPRIFAGAGYTYDEADVGAYQGIKSQQNLSIYGSYLQPVPGIRWQVSVSLRNELQTGYQVPFLFSIGLEGPIYRTIEGKINFSRNFRAPTMNERYWLPGGNPDLLPETSWNQEAGISFKPSTEKLKGELRITAFSSIVDHWILWVPGTSYWSVENVQKVWARGLETFVEFNLGFSRIRLMLSASYVYTLSTNEQKLGNLDASYKKQLIYTPLNKFSLRANALFNGFTAMIRTNYTGIVYTSKDDLESLPGYTLLDAGFGKEFRVKDLKIAVQFNMNNILNTFYQVVPYRPMPGRNFMISANFKYDRKNAKKD
jgi:vitamin B12 transporter